MAGIYNGGGTTADGDATFDVLQSTVDCRKAIYNEVVNRLNRPGLTNRRGMGALIAKIALAEGNERPCLAC